MDAFSTVVGEGTKNCPDLPEETDQHLQQCLILSDILAESGRGQTGGHDYCAPRRVTAEVEELQIYPGSSTVSEKAPAAVVRPSGQL